MKHENLFSQIPDSFPDEIYETLLKTGQLRLERILSFGQKTPPGEWFDGETDEWVVLLKGNAGLSFDGENEVLVMQPGDYVHIPAHRRHRVEWTDTEQATVWLALHYR